jgi:hypothetical protein
MKAKDDISSNVRPALLQEFDPDGSKFRPHSLLHARVKSDIFGAFKQMKLFCNTNRQQPIDVPQSVINLTMKVVLELLTANGVHSSTIPVGSVKFNPKGSCGYHFNERYTSKQDFVEKGGLLGEDYYNYRNFAHVHWIPLLWMFKDKVELLPIDKVEEHNIRCFEFGNVLSFFSSAQDNQAFNKLFYQMKEVCAVGSVFCRGGFHDLIKKLEAYLWKFMGDVRKWDKNIICALLWICCEIRIMLYVGPEPEAYAHRQRWYYTQIIYRYTVLANGQVIYKPGGQCSGGVNTTSDNTLIHIFILFMYVIFYWDHEKDGPVTLHKILRKLLPEIYSDDHLGGVDASAAFLAPYEPRNEFYRRVGLELKREDDVVQISCVGLKFLGATVRKYCGYYVPQYDAERIRSGLCLVTERPLTPAQEYAKALALYILAAFVDDTKFLTHLREYVLFCHMRAGGHVQFTNVQEVEELIGALGVDVELQMESVPSYAEVVAFWTGLESKSRPKSQTRKRGALAGAHPSALREADSPSDTLLVSTILYNFLF